MLRKAILFKLRNPIFEKIGFLKLDHQVFSFSIRGSSFFTKKLEPRILFFEEKQKPRNQTITTRIIYKKGLDRCSFLILFYI
jgi:hypothetical protein